MKIIRAPYKASEAKGRKRVIISYPPKEEKHGGGESIEELKQIMEAVIIQQMKAARQKGEPEL